MMNKIKPEPCPICGGAAEVWVEFVSYSDEYDYDEKNLYHCGCKECELTRSCYWDKDQAIRWWNELAGPINRRLEMVRDAVGPSVRVFLDAAAEAMLREEAEE